MKSSCPRKFSVLLKSISRSESVHWIQNPRHKKTRQKAGLCSESLVLVSQRDTEEYTRSIYIDLTQVVVCEEVLFLGLVKQVDGFQLQFDVI